MSHRPDHYLDIQLEGKEGEEIFEFTDVGLTYRPFIDDIYNIGLDPKDGHVYATYDAWKGSGEWHVKKGEKALFWKDGKAFFHMSQVDETDETDETDDWEEEYHNHDDWGDRDGGLNHSDYF